MSLAEIYDCVNLSKFDCVICISIKVLFTDRYKWQNFGLRFLGLVNRLYTVHSSLVAYLAQVKSVKNYPTRSDSVLSWAWVF